MPNYVPIQDLTTKNLADTDYIPVSDGVSAYGVQATQFKSYSTDAAEAAADRAEAVAETVEAEKERTINIWDEQWQIGSIGGTGAIVPNPNPSQIVSKNFIPCDSSTTYYAKTPGDGVSMSIRIAQYASDKSFIGFIGYIANQKFTTGATAKYLLFTTAGTATTTYEHDISINVLVGDYEKYYPYTTFRDYIARSSIDDLESEIDGFFENTGNLWDEQIESGYYLNNSGAKAIASTPAYCTKNYIPVSPSTQYYFSCVSGNSRVAQYNSSKQFISFLGYLANSYFTTDASAAYLMFWSGGSNTYDSGRAVYTGASGQKAYLPHKAIVDYVAREEIEKLANSYIVVGAGQTYTSVVEGFAAAVAEDKGCIILPGTYNLVNEGASTGVGITAPKHVIGYGAKIVANLPSESWDYSALNMSGSMDEVIIEGLEIEVTNCRYCVHDEEYNRAGYYHHVFKNCKMTHNSEKSATLIRPICIGGGFGNSCLVEIENCEFSSKDENNNDVNYHANSLGQTGSCVVKCKDSVFETSIGISGNAMTGFVNEMYVCGCLVGTLPADPDIANSKMIQWNNVVRGN